ncbi:MAG: histone deacetylase [Chloroflexi bacterium]|nr:histone deacetylase [Chloroflexota bacterium]
MTTPPPEELPNRERTALLRSVVFREHDTGGHPENAGRLVAIDDTLERLHLLRDRPDIPFSAAPDDALARVHDPRYIAGVQEFAARGGGWLDADTVVGPSSVDIAALAAGAGIAAVDAALDGQTKRSFVLGRPPGHHATPTRGMGFCIFNTVAVAAAHALSRGVDRVMIVDWDVHHGNGTQDAFYESDQVLFCSVHQWPLYPGTGAATERGTGRGAGYTINVPLAAGADDGAYADIFDQVILPAVSAFRPQLVLVSAGFDAHADDPLGGMRVTAQGFGDLARRVVQIAETHAAGCVIAILEGGYDPAALAASVVATLGALDGNDALLNDTLEGEGRWNGDATS